MQHKYIRLDEKDNVMVALQDLKKGTIAFTGNATVELVEDIPAKHKFFLQDLDANGSVIMYGVLVGRTQYSIKAGSLMSVSNTSHAADPYQYRNPDIKWTPPDVSRFANRTFDGYHRRDG